MAFRGTFDYTLDAKNRLTVPAKFRPQFAGGVVLAKGLKANVGLWVPEVFDRYVDSVLSGFHPLSDEYGVLNEHFSGGALDLELDGAGRVGLSPRHLAYAGLSKDVVVSGAMNHLQIWDRATWDARSEARAAEVKTITDRLSAGAAVLPLPTGP